jgi:hypothetical protein
MKVYIAGPMRGKPYYNFKAFDHAKLFLSRKGHRPFSPADWDRGRGLDPFSLPESHNWDEFPSNLRFTLEEAIKRDIEALLDCEAIYMLLGWEYSVGARAEHAIALWMGIRILYETR